MACREGFGYLSEEDAAFDASGEGFGIHADITTGFNTENNIDTNPTAQEVFAQYQVKEIQIFEGLVPQSSLDPME